MDFNLIVAIDEEYGIGKNNSLPWHCPEDLKYFKDITTGYGKEKNNIVVMGSKTYFSIPEKFRPLKGRKNFVLTTDKSKLDLENVERGSIQDFLQEYKEYTLGKIFVVGGSQIYKIFYPYCRKVYCTRIKGKYECDTKVDFDLSDLFLTSSEKFSTHIFEVYQRNNEEIQYLNFLKKILVEGNTRSDRTGTGTISLFAPLSLKFDISERIPLLTTKQMGWKTVVKELLWFLRGDTDAKILQKEKCHIWNGNTSREFLDQRGLKYEEGIIGPGYGWQWRHFGAKYDEKYADTTKLTAEERKNIGGIDQISEIIELLKNDPYSRRILLNSWNASDLSLMALPPCHIQVQFYVENDADGIKHLSCHMYQRSVDCFLGLPFNIFSYAVLTSLIALKCNMKPNKLVLSFGDCHIYSNHVEQVYEQINRKPFLFPTLDLHPDIVNKDWHGIKFSDFTVKDYQYHPSIKGKMAA